MCGICGIINFDGKPVEESALIQMRDTMIHRGPDDAGIFLDNNIGFGHRRLSIIDIERSHQPMSNEDGTIWITYNGEIYNYKELREFLIKKGHKFKSRGDTEVLIHLYEEYGEKMLEKLNGMFAFAIWENNKKTLFAARDRLGIKPFYFFHSGNHKFLIFASEMKAILSYPYIQSSINIESIPLFLGFGYVYGENTLLNNIYELLPGHFIIIKVREFSIKTKKYWDVTDKDYEIYSSQQYVEKLEELLEDSVQKRMISDVPIGVFLSGGIDSSIITYYMAKHLNNVKSFSVGFKEKGYSELDYANIVANRLQTDHHSLIVKADEFFNLLPLLIWYNDEPILHPSSIPIYLISKFARDKGIKVLLSGEGADELFAGYSSYSAFVRDCKIRNTLSKMLMPFFAKLVYFIKKDNFSKRLTLSDNELILSHVSSDILNLSDVLSINTKEGYFNILQQDNSFKNTLSKILYAMLKTELITLLIREDKMSMAANIETRVPYLDHRIVEFSFMLPPSLKLHTKTKIILRKIAKKFLPPLIINRKKMGFLIPLNGWLKRDEYREVLMNAEIPLLKKKKVRVMIKGMEKGNNENVSILWKILNLELWRRILIEKQNYI